MQKTRFLAWLLAVLFIGGLCVDWSYSADPSLLKKSIEELLPDLKEETLTQSQNDSQEPSLDLDPYQEVFNTPEDWNKMRQLIESGQPIYRPLPSTLVRETEKRKNLAPKELPPPGFTVQLPYESRLTVSGRKTIGFGFKSTTYTNSQFANQQNISSSQNNFDLQQELQVRINGQVGRKVTVNVDFDDSKEDKKDISIVYKGDPDEIVQKAAFGDVSLNLPSTEFVGYSRQVFGASAELKYKAIRGYVVGSRTKGQTETKEFKGTITLQRQNIADTAYLRRRFYNYKKLITTGSFDPTSIAIYIDRRTSVDGTFQSITTADGSFLGVANFTGGRFEPLRKGIDYTVDASSGVITFRDAIASNHVLAMDFKYTSGPNSGLFQSQIAGNVFAMLKFDESQILSIPATEERTHYSLGVTKIVRDNNQGNFTLQLRDLNDLIIGPSLTPPIIYQPNNSGSIHVDFEQGTFVLTSTISIPSAPGIYDTTPKSGSRFFVEYRSRVKTYILRPNIVLNSERITLNGRLLTRDSDYFIDYASGFLTFFREDQINEDTIIRATYDYSPFGIAGAQQDTLVGARLELQLGDIFPDLKKSSIGTSVIYNFAPKQTAAPDIRQTAGSFLVSEADINLKELSLPNLPQLKSSFAAEAAKSFRNPNTFGKALIENMEGIKDETSASLNLLNYQVAANPGPEPGRVVSYLNAMANTDQDDPNRNLTNVNILTKSINPDAPAREEDKTQVLNIDYDFTATSSTEASIVTVLSPGGVDLSDKQFLEMWIKGDSSLTSDTNTTLMKITLGQIDEDSDGQNGTAGKPKTEDLNNNGTLDTISGNEDIGWNYVNPNSSISKVGNNNLRIDSQDLDRNGALDSGSDLIGGRFGYDESQTLLFPTGSTENAVDFSTWTFVRIPLNISSATSSYWTAIKHLRISLRTATGAFQTSRHRLSIAKIAIVGNKWKTSFNATVSSVTAKAVSTEDDSNYESPDFASFRDLNQVNTTLTGPQPTERREQSLAINYGFTAGAVALSTVTLRTTTISPMDFSSYREIRFFARRNTNNVTTVADDTLPDADRLFYRVGSDTDYLEYSIPFSLLPIDTWQEFTIKQVDITGDQRPDIWQAPVGSDITVTIVGRPNLTSVAQQKLGIQNTAGGARSGEVWVNEIHGADVITRSGSAFKLSTDHEWQGWGKLGAALRNIDRNFETYSSVVSNQDRREESAYFNLTRLSYFPMEFHGSRSKITTPNIQTIGSNTTLVSVLQEGKVESEKIGWSGTLQVPRYPKFGLGFDSGKIDSTNISRTDRDQSMRISMDYEVPGAHRFLPKTINATYKLSRLQLDFGNAALSGATELFGVSDTKNVSHDFTTKLTFQPHKNFTFTPNYAYSTTNESKEAIISTAVVSGSTVPVSFLNLNYDKLRSQTIGFESNFSLRKWFSPTLRYKITTNETFGIPIKSNLHADDFKSVERTSSGDIGWNFAYRDFSAKNKYLQSLNFSSNYTIEDGDSWEGVQSGYNSLMLFTVRQPLKAGNTQANRRQLTLRDNFRSTQRWNPFDWGSSQWKGPLATLKTLALTSTVTDTREKKETTQTVSRVHTQILPDFVISMSQTEALFNAYKWMSNSQLNLKTQYKTVDTEKISEQKAKTYGGDWRFTLFKKYDLFLNYSTTNDQTFDRLKNVIGARNETETFGTQVGVKLGKWRLTTKYEQSKTLTKDSAGRITNDTITRTPSLQAYADLTLPRGLKLPFSKLVVFTNRIRTTNTLSLVQKRSKVNTVSNNSDAYSANTSLDYELTSNVNMKTSGGLSYTKNKQSSQADFYSYELATRIEIRF